MIKIRQLFDSETWTYTYLVFSDYGHDAMLIDPVLGKVNNYLKLLQEYESKLKYVFDTHVHADHITGSGKLRELTNCITLLGATTNAACVSQTVVDNEKLYIDAVEFTVIETPGHTQDSFCLYTAGFVFTGDTLFIRGTGRTDFQAGSPSDQYNSIVNKLFKLPDETVVYPGHDYNGNTTSTIGEEKRLNPRLAGKSQEEFINIMNNLNLANPKFMDIAVPANLKCGLA